VGYDISGEWVVLLFLLVMFFDDVASAGRLGTLALLGRRICSNGERKVGLGTSNRALVKFSTLLLCFNDFI
jgi:hypothetical protein